MNWEKFIEGKTSKELEEKYKELLETIAFYAPGILEMISKYIKRWRPDLFKEMLALETEKKILLSSKILSEDEENEKYVEWIRKFAWFMQQITEEAKLRGRPMS